MKKCRNIALVCGCYVAFLFVGGVAGALAGSTASLFSAGGSALVLAGLTYQVQKNRAWAFWAGLTQVFGLALFFGMRFWYTNGRVPLMCGIVSLLVFLLMLWFRKDRCAGEKCDQKSL